jgi:beta-galactosidase
VPTDNDEGGGDRSYAHNWRKAGLDTFKISVKDLKTNSINNGTISVKVNSVLEFKKGKMELNTEYMFYWDGEISVKYDLKLLDNCPLLARVGVQFAMNQSFNEIGWFGRGPFESYWDRKESAHFGLYSGKVADQHFPYVMPQENGNKSDVSWIKILGLGRGLEIECHSPLNVNVQDYSHKALNTSKTSHELMRGDKTYIHIDYQQMGLGGDDSWTPRVHPEFQLKANEYSFGFTLKPF